MSKHRSNHLIIRLIAGLIALMIFVFSVTACAPRVASSMVPTGVSDASQVDATVEAENLYPLVYPDVNNGENVYAEECETCHGENGRGDGSRASDLSIPVTSLGEKNNVRMSQPVLWYMHVTYGDMGHGMPGFNNRLDARDRWDVVAYTTLLNYSISELETGKAIFSERCETCHDSSSLTYSSEPAHDSITSHSWQDPTVLPRMSDRDIWENVTQGIDQEMPSFELILTEEERWDVTSYVRTLSYLGAMSFVDSNEELKEKAELVAGSSDVDTGSVHSGIESYDIVKNKSEENVSYHLVAVNGIVANSRGEAITGNYEVMLQRYEKQQKENTLAVTNLDQNGYYQFPAIKIENDADDYLIVRVDVDQTIYYSEPVKLTEITQDSDIYQKIFVYDTTNDVSKLYAERWHIYLDYSENDVIKVLEFFIITNPSEKLIVPKNLEDPLLVFELPEDATNLNISGDRQPLDIIETQNAFGVIKNIKPKSNTQVVFSYEIPYKIEEGLFKNKEQELALPVPLHVDSVVVMKPNDNIQLVGSSLKEVGQQDMQGVEVQVFTANGLDKDSQLDVLISKQTDIYEWLTNNPINGLFVGITALFLAVLIAVFSINRLNQKKSLQQVSQNGIITSQYQEADFLSVDTMIEMILALDDAYQSGKIPEDAYRKRRAELKLKINKMKESQTKKSK